MPDPRGNPVPFPRKERQRLGKSGWVSQLPLSPPVCACMPAAWALHVIRFPSRRNYPSLAHCMLQIPQPFSQRFDARPSGHVTHANRVVEYRMEPDFHIMQPYYSALGCTSRKSRQKLGTLNAKNTMMNVKPMDVGTAP